MRTSKVSRRSELRTFLLGAFSQPTDLHRCVQLVAGGQALVDACTIRGGKLSEVVDAVIDVLETESAATSAFFEALVGARSRRETEIRALQRQWQTVVLFLSATPADQPRLAVENEAARIDEALSAFGPAIGLVIRHQVDVDDWRRSLEIVQPHVVHFSGHGSIWGRLVLESADSAVDLNPAPMIEQLVRVGVRGVVLNACHSARLAKALQGAGVEWAVGMDDAVLDELAVAFAEGFYESLARGASPAVACEAGRKHPRWRKLPQVPNPRFFPAGPEAPARSPALACGASVASRATLDGFESLFVRLFDTPGDVRAFLSADASTAGLVPHISFVQSARAVAADAADLLRRHGLVDEILLRRLAAARPEAKLDLCVLGGPLGFDPSVGGWEPVALPDAEIASRLAAAGEDVSVRVVSHDNDHPFPTEPTFRIEAPARFLVDAGRAERAIGDPMRRIAVAASRLRPTPTITILPQCTPGAAIRVGYEVRAVTQLRCRVAWLAGVWELGVPTGDAAGLIIHGEGPREVEGVALLVSIAQDVRRDYDAWAQVRANNLRVLTACPPGGAPNRTALSSPEQAVAWAHAMGERVRKEMPSRSAPLHIFAAAPTPVAVALGRELNAIGHVHLWDLHRLEHRYREAFAFWA